jgi:LmbE family N-acetylglucosaminyl deacetylase
MGCAGLMGRLAQEGARMHVLYLAVDGFHHYGLEGETDYDERVAEIEEVVALFGDRCTYEIAYGGQDLIERLDSLPRRELVDRFEAAMNEHEPELVLMPAVPDYDQDHQAVFEAGLAATRPIGRQFGKWLAPHVLTYEAAKMQWASSPLPRLPALCDITDVIELKLEAIRRYHTQHRPAPHMRSLENTRALATLRGAELGVSYAEAFGVLRTSLGRL